MNRLLSATVAGQTTTSTYNGDGLRVSQTTGGTTSTSTYAVHRRLPVVLVEHETKYVYGPQGLAYAELPDGTVHVYHQDGLGSTRAITSSTGEVLQTYRTDAFGNPDPGGTTGSVQQPMQYTGEPRDRTGLVYLRARYYDPQIGRFLTRDPFAGFTGAPLSLNRYTYVQNNPVNLTDPSGHLAVPVAVAACAAYLPCALAASVFVISVYNGFQVWMDQNAHVDPPNPGGSKGKAAHRESIERRIRELQEEGLVHEGGGTLKEEWIRTPGGAKRGRRPDITMRDPETDEVYRENVGRGTQSGEPIARERRALDDIERATGQRPEFTPYNHP